MLIRNVEDYGAVHDGTTDDATAIQAAINDLPATGGIVYLPAGNYAIGSTIEIGNGTNSTGSTRRGVWLMSEGISGPFGAFGWPGIEQSATTLTWISGSGLASMVRINGPLAGWGMTDITLLGGSEAEAGLEVVSGIYGRVERVGVYGCQNAFVLTTITPSGPLAVAGVAVGSYHNVFDQIAVSMPGSFAFQTGLLLNAATDSSQGGVFFNRFENVLIAYAQQTTNQVEAIRLDGCDSNRFNESHFAGFPGANNYLISFIYATKADWPSDNTFDGISFGTAASGAFYNANTPVGSNPNRIVNIGAPDGRPADPALSNLAWGYGAAEP